jgi:hypothetical protein
MKTIPAGLLTHLQGDTTSTCVCFKVTLQRSPQVTLGFTDHDEDVIFEGIRYQSQSGFLPSAYETQTKLAPDNSQARGLLDSSLIDPQDLLNGAWDYAEVEIFQVNWKDLSQGKDILNRGRFGDIQIQNGKFETELRGLSSAFTQSRNRVYSPTCTIELGSAQCGVDLTPYTVTGTITAISADQIVLFDSGRTEAGPTGKTITGITKAGAASVTSAAHGLLAGQYVFFHSVLGMTQINGLYGVVQTVATNTFTVNINTTSFGTYTSGGVVAPQGTVGYFAAGKIQMTSGEAAGLSMEIKESAPSLFIVQLEFPLPVAVGDTYTAIAGCTKRFKEDCVTKFSNAVNFRGHPHVPGLNRVMRSGR